MATEISRSLLRRGFFISSQQYLSVFTINLINGISGHLPAGKRLHDVIWVGQKLSVKKARWFIPSTWSTSCMIDVSFAGDTVRQNEGHICPSWKVLDTNLWQACSLRCCCLFLSFSSSRADGTRYVSPPATCNCHTPFMTLTPAFFTRTRTIHFKWISPNPNH